MDKKVQKALKLFGSGFNCAQSVVGTFCEDFDIDEQLAMKISGGFGGGMRCGEVCGAVSGAVMVIGLKYGQSVALDKISKDKCNSITSKYMEEFTKRNGTILCRELLGYDMRDAVARTKNSAKKNEICTKAIEASVLLLQEMGF